MECQALVYVRDAAQGLGATVAQAEDTLPLRAGVARLQGRALPPVPRSEVRDPALGSADDDRMSSRHGGFREQLWAEGVVIAGLHVRGRGRFALARAEPGSPHEKEAS